MITLKYSFFKNVNLRAPEGIQINKDIKRFRAFMFTYWAMMLSVSGMYTMYISQQGLSKGEVSITVTVYTMSSLIGQSFIGYLVDKFHCAKKIMFISISMGLIVAAGFPFIWTSWQAYLLMFAWGFCVYGTVPLTEAWCIDTLKAYGEQRNFGETRGFGSIGYALSGVLLGMLLQNFGWKIYYWYITVGIVAALLIIFFMSDMHSFHGSTASKNNSIEEKVSLKEAMGEIFRIKPLLVMIIIIFMYSFVVRGIYGYLGVLIADYGGGALSLGFTYFFDAGPELITFFLAARLLRKFSGKNLIFIAFILQIIRLTVILIFNNAMAVMLMGTLSGFAFGLLATSYKTTIYELAPAKYKASCMSLSESIIGLSGIVSVPIFGVVFAKFGTNAAISLGLGIYVILVLIMLKDIINLKPANRKVDIS